MSSNLQNSEKLDKVEENDVPNILQFTNKGLTIHKTDYYDTSEPGFASKSTRHLRAKRSLEANRYAVYEPNLSSNKIPCKTPKAYDYSRFKRLPWNTEIDYSNGKTLDIDLDEVPKLCLSKRVLVSTNKTKTMHQRLRVNILHQQPGKYPIDIERLIVQEKLTVKNQCLVWRLEYHPSQDDLHDKKLTWPSKPLKNRVGQKNFKAPKVQESVFVNDNDSPFQRVDIKEEITDELSDPLTVSDSDQLRIKTELNESDVKTEPIMSLPKTYMKKEKSDVHLNIKQEPLEMNDNETMDSSHGLNMCANEMTDNTSVKEELTEIVDCEIFELK